MRPRDVLASTQFLRGRLAKLNRFAQDLLVRPEHRSGGRRMSQLFEAIRQYTHDTGFVAEIRWVSKTRVIADVVQNPYFNLGITNYCCRLKRSGNRWVVTSFEKISIAPADEANGPIAI
ncbi:MAG: hypothetical protein DME40_09365 [Verrucomicrobia bacterium]|nr:MAG: hypothetical protein DME40_09365 [Verrucomicrobiota bacterium]